MDATRPRKSLKKMQKIDRVQRTNSASNGLQASKSVGAGDVHSAATADTLAARAAEGQGGILFVLDFNEGIKDHGRAFGGIDGVNLDVGLGILLSIEAVDLELDV